MHARVQDLGAGVVIVVAGEGAKFGGGEGTPRVLELHADDVTCGLFRLTGAVDGIPPPTEDEIYHRDRDEKTLLLQTSGTRFRTLHRTEITRYDPIL